MSKRRHHSHRSGSHRAIRRESEALIRRANEEELVPSGVEVIDRDANPILPQTQAEIAHDASKLFAAHATTEAFTRLNHNIKHRYDKRPFPVLGVVLGKEDGSDEAEIDPDTEKARMINNISSAVASYGGSLAVIDVATSLGSNRGTERDTAKISKILRDPETSMAVVIYPSDIPTRLADRASQIENILATESSTPVLGLVMPHEPETAAQLLQETGVHSIPHLEQ